LLTVVVVSVGSVEIVGVLSDAFLQPWAMRINRITNHNCGRKKEIPETMELCNFRIRIIVIIFMLIVYLLQLGLYSRLYLIV
jgi:hypothetical protein